MDPVFDTLCIASTPSRYNEGLKLVWIVLTQHLFSLVPKEFALGDVDV